MKNLKGVSRLIFEIANSHNHLIHQTRSKVLAHDLEQDSMLSTCVGTGKLVEACGVVTAGDFSIKPRDKVRIEFPGVTSITAKVIHINFRDNIVTLYNINDRNDFELTFKEVEDYVTASSI